MKILRETKGQALVEFALLLPMLLLILVGIVEFGCLFATYLELENAARDGARFAAVHKEISAATISARTKEYVSEKFVLLDSTKLTGSNFLLQMEGNGSDVWVKLSLAYPYQIKTPIMTAITGDEVNLKAAISMRRE